jgi:hypothetical protein
MDHGPDMGALLPLIGRDAVAARLRGLTRPAAFGREQGGDLRRYAVQPQRLLVEHRPGAARRNDYLARMVAKVDPPVKRAPCGGSGMKVSALTLSPSRMLPL